MICIYIYIHIYLYTYIYISHCTELSLCFIRFLRQYNMPDAFGATSCC